MSNTKTRKPSLPNSVEKYIGKEWGEWAPGDRIPVDIELAKCQRPYKKQNVYKYIAKVGGLDKHLFGYATAVRRKSDGKLALINGQHRINLVKILSPATKEVPAQIIEVDDKEFLTYSSNFFAEVNGGVSKTLSNEELFKAKVLAQDTEALNIERIIKIASVSIGEVNQSSNTSPVVYANFVKCIKLSESATIRSIELLKTAFKTVNDDVLHGLVYLLSNEKYKDLGNANTAVGKHFEIWLTQAVPMFHGINDLKFKKYRQGPWQRGVAYGIAQSFAKFQRNKGLYAPAIGAIKELWEKGFNDDSGIL
jgi:hypothetical protein